MIKKILYFCVLIAFLCNNVNGDKTGKLMEFFKWKTIEYELPPMVSGSVDFTFPGPTRVNQYNYVPLDNLPMGVNHHKGRIFITMPRRRSGVVSTLNYINVESIKSTQSPKLIPYPSIEFTSLDPELQANSAKIISVYRTKTDSCNRLWFVDTGILEYSDAKIQIQPASIWIINLENDEVIRRYEIPSHIVTDGRGMASITVDVDSDRCDDAYAYIPDLFEYGLYVYSFNENRMWSFHHNYLSFDPLYGDLDIAGQQFQWNDGIFSITLGNKNPDGYKTAYFHAMASIAEFTVSTEVLRNETLSERDYHGHDFELLGIRGLRKQSTTHVFDPVTETIFFSEISNNAITCWNTRKPLSEENIGLVDRDNVTMIYPSDVSLDENGVLWVMTNRLPLFIYSELDPDDFNFRIFRQTVRKATQNTICSV